MSFLHHGSRSLAALALLSVAPLCRAQVSTCNALTLYGNAANTGACRDLNPATQNRWGCALSSGALNVNLAFNAMTPLHIGVRTGAGAEVCQGNATLAGNWPRLDIAPGQPGSVCNVRIGFWTERLNAVPPMPAHDTTACRAGFLAARQAGRLSEAVMQTYLDTCDAQACP